MLSRRQALLATATVFSTALLLGQEGSPRQYTVQTVAGADPVRDNGRAVLGIFDNITAVAFGPNGELYIADSVAQRIRKVVPDASQTVPEYRYVSGIITTFAGTGGGYFNGNDEEAPANETPVNRPMGLAVDGQGNLYIADSGNRRIRRVTPDGVISTVLREGLGVVTGLAFDRDGNLCFLDIATNTGLGVAKRIAMEGGSVSVIPGTEALRNPIALAFGPDNTAFIIETGTNSVRVVAQDGTSSRLEAAGIVAPRALAFDREDNLFVADGSTRLIIKLNADSTTGEPILPPFGAPAAMAFDPSGNLALAFAQQINLWVPSQASLGAPVVGEQNRRGRDGGPALETLFYRPAGAVGGDAGDVFIVSAEAAGIRRVRGSDGIVESIRSTNGVGIPGGVHRDRNGNLWVTDVTAHRLLRVDGSSLLAQVVAGVGRPGDTGDNGPAVEAALLGPTSVVTDPAGNVYLLSGGRVRRIDATTGIISAFAQGPISGLATDDDGNVYVADLRQIRKFAADGTLIDELETGASGVAFDSVTQSLFLTNANALYRWNAESRERELVAGDPAVPGYDAGHFNNPGPVSVDAAGNLFVTDRNNHRIRKVTASSETSRIPRAIED